MRNWQPQDVGWITPFNAMALTIPHRHKTVLERFANLSDEIFQELVAVLQLVTPAAKRSDLANFVSSRVQRLNADEVEQMLNVIVSLYEARNALGESGESFADQLTEVAGQEGLFDQQTRKRFRDRLIQLLSLDDSVGVATKAIDVLSEQERFLCSARILTDIRPIFGTNPSKPPLAMAIIHTLRIAYHGDEDLKEFFVAMDTDDLVKLAELIRRAEQKAKTLESLLRQAKLPYIEPSAHEHD